MRRMYRSANKCSAWHTKVQLFKCMMNKFNALRMQSKYGLLMETNTQIKTIEGDWYVTVSAVRAA